MPVNIAAVVDNDDRLALFLCAGTTNAELDVVEDEYRVSKLDSVRQVFSKDKAVMDPDITPYGGERVGCVHPHAVQSDEDSGEEF